jgi:serine/threonine-protein kinase
MLDGVERMVTGSGLVARERAALDVSGAGWGLGGEVVGRGAGGVGGRAADRKGESRGGMSDQPSTAEALVARAKGEVVQGLRIMQEIGRGAASIIYLTQDPKTKQIWALKHVQKLTPKDQRFLDQAETEYKTSQAVKHPAVRSIDKCVKNGTLFNTKELFLVMELVDGLPLDQYKVKGLEELLDILVQVSGGLAAMHAAGFVHADMKPHNVIVGPDFDGKLTAKIIDLGQSCKAGTVKERIQGTPDYIAPEQVHRREITPKTDVFNFGATMYFLLTGQKVPTAMAAGGDSLTGALQDSRIARARPVKELRPDVPEKLGELVMQCVEVDPDQRPEMSAVVSRLDLVLGMARAQAAGKSGGKGASRSASASGAWPTGGK